MMLALLFSCMSSSEPETVQPADSFFLSQCKAPSSNAHRMTLNVLFDRLDTSDCDGLYAHLSTTKALSLSNHPEEFFDLSVLAEFTQIESLHLSDSQVSDLQPISGFKSLHTLHVEHCPIEDLRPLSSLTSLQTLLLDYSMVRDLTPIQGLSSLKQLGLRKTGITSLDGLSGMPSLQILEASGNPILSLEPLAALNQLQILSLRQTQVSDLKPLSKHSGLSFLDLKSTTVKDIEPLAQLSNLKVLDLSKTKVTDLSPAAQLSSLIEINVRGTGVSEAACRQFAGPIQGCASLSPDSALRWCTSPADFPFKTQVSIRSLLRDINEIDCTKVQAKLKGISDFTSTQSYPDPRIFAYLPNLQTINIPITSVFNEYCTEDSSAAVDALCQRKKAHMRSQAEQGKAKFLTGCRASAGPSGLTYRVLKSQTQAESCEELWESLAMTESLTLQELELTSLEPIGLLPNLQELVVDYNRIRDLSPLSQRTNLQILWIDDNYIDDLSPLHGLPLLWLSAGDNRIKDLLPLAESTTLQRLWLGGNKVTDIAPLTNLTDLQKLHLAINDIQDISPLSELTNLSTLYLGQNQIQNLEPLRGLKGLFVLSSGLDNDESPLERQQWFVKGNPFDRRICQKEDLPSALVLFCAETPSD
ncbi:MAG: leucine-rich repeat domain-containing protein [Myxococcota bacterium]